MNLSQAAQDVLRERTRQIENHGYDTEHDDGHDGHEIAAAAAYYAMPPGAREWPATETGYGDTFGEAIAPENWTMKDYGDRRRELVVAAALLLAEIERMDRAEGAHGVRACETCGGTGIAKLSGDFCTNCNGKGRRLGEGGTDGR